MIEPDFLLFSNRNCIFSDFVSHFCQVIWSMQAFSFAPVGNQSAHRFWSGRIILALLVAAFSCHKHCFQLFLRQGTTVIQYCWSILVKQSYCNYHCHFLLQCTWVSTFHVPSPFLKSCMVAFGLILMLAQKICMVVFNQLF